jgi:PAS domain S-box-containing protein
MLYRLGLLLKLVVGLFDRLPLRFLLVVPFVVQIIIITTIIGFLCYKTGQGILADISKQLHNEIISHIDSRTNEFLSIPQTINHFNKLALEYQQIDVNNTAELARHFIRQIRFFPTLTYISYTSVQGDITSAFRDFNTGELLIHLANSDTGRAHNVYSINEQDYIDKLIKSTPNYDPTTRIWYKTVVAAGQDHWYPPYKYFSFDGLGVGLGTPIYDQNGIMQGLFTADMSLSKISEFLHTLKIGHTGVAFIMEEDGNMIASSDLSALFAETSAGTKRLTAAQMQNNLIKNTALYLQQQAIDFSQNNQKQNFRFKLDKNEYFLQLSPLHYHGDLRWWIAVIIPQSDFTSHIDTMINLTILATIIMILISIIAGLFTSQRLIRPILILNQAAKKLAEGNWQYDVVIRRNDELGDLSSAFQVMAEQLSNLFKATQENETRLRQFLDAMPIGIMILDPDTNINYINRQASDLLDYDPHYSDRCEINFYQAGSQKYYPLEALPSIRALNGEISSVDDVEIYRDNKLIPLEIWGSPIFDHQQNVIYAIMAFRDISERKQAEIDRMFLAQEQEAKQVALLYNRQIEDKNAQLINLNQEKNEFLGIVAHDLKNPLSGILGLAELLLESEGNMPAEELFEYAQLLRYNAENMFQLITNLLDVNAIESGKFKFKFELIDILPIVQLVVKDYTERAKAKNIKLNLHIDAEQYLATIDANTLRQILDNLISNAIKYSPYDKNVYVYIYNNINEIRCDIQDQGPGLSPEEQKQLFGKFTRLSTRPTAGEHSTGLGLFIVKKLVMAMNGQIWCDSKLGEGSTFCLSLPISQNY